jgi:NAD(P)-dependent dehydrogenase (short-subunit alcohol dehydrogenase family)
MSQRVCVVVGVGPGNGAAIAERFAREGYSVALLARSTQFTDELAARLPDARAYACNVADGASLQQALDGVRRDLGEIDALVYNAGSGAWGSVEEISPAQLEAALQVNTIGLLMASQNVIPHMREARAGSIIVIGATASRRGGAKTAAFAPAKAAQRSLAESMARHLWPAGIHVALVIIDGVVDLERTRARMPDKADTFFVKPADVAAMVYAISEQPHSAWSFEVEARPFSETW